jgi:NADPH:quinone reductase-like Zn-dependent oxidoreductase
VVVGLGVVGILVAALLARTGAVVLGSEPAPARRAAADAFGVRAIAPEEVPEAVAGGTGGRGADLVIEASGNPQALASSLGLLAHDGMVCDLDALRAALQAIVGRIAGRDLEEIRPPTAEAVTVEVLAYWTHQSLVPTLQQAGGDTLAVRVWESDSDFGGYAGPVA